jgi:hypothetical protein
MIRTTGFRAGVAVGVAGAALLAATLSGAATATARSSIQVLPTPFAFVSNLDLECFRTNPYTPPTTPIVTRHLNPLLTTLPVEQHALGNREQLCVPVAKNNVLPPPAVLDFIRFVDLACYRIQGVNVSRTLQLTHLNPVLRAMGVPPNVSTMTVPEQLCVPVIKNGLVPPAEVLRLVQFIDLKCYATTPPNPLNLPLVLAHLNPVLAGLPPTQVVVTNSRQLCVPVQKGTQPIPSEILNIVRWIDLQKYDLATPTTPPAVNLVLNHINPLLVGLPPEQVTLFAPLQLALPVAKNGAIPPA